MAFSHLIVLFFTTFVICDYPVLPSQFNMPFRRINEVNDTTDGHWYYDETNMRTVEMHIGRSSLVSWCNNPKITGGEDGTCRIVTKQFEGGPWKLIYYPDLGKCCRCCNGSICGSILRPNFLETSKSVLVESRASISYEDERYDTVHGVNIWILPVPIPGTSNLWYTSLEHHDLPLKLVECTGVWGFRYYLYDPQKIEYSVPDEVFEIHAECLENCDGKKCYDNAHMKMPGGGDDDEQGSDEL